MNDIEKARRKKRDSSGWTLEEIKKRALAERQVYEKLTESEPDALASGKCMDKILEDDDEKSE